MKRIAFLSPLGGCGRSTLAAHIAVLLAERGLAALAIDLCPQNALGLHLGQPASTGPAGWHDAVQQGQWWGQAGLEGPQGVRLLPHGAWPQACSAACELPEDWLEAQLRELDFPDDGVVLLDTPALPAPLALQAARCADLALLVLDVSAGSCRWLEPLQNFIAQLPATARHAVVLNGADARSSLRSAALQALTGQWQASLLPYPLHRDEHVQLALQQGLCVHQLAPHAQLSHDLQGMADWLLREGLAP